MKIRNDQEKHSKTFRRFTQMVDQSDLPGHHNLYLIIHMLVLLLVFDLSETVVRKQFLQRALEGLVRSTKWQKHRATIF